MALVVEDGTAKADAESYCTTLHAGKYLRDRGRANDWDMLDILVREQYLRQATDFMTQKYRVRWSGRRFNTTQRLDWPRVGVVIEEFEGGYGMFNVSYETVPEEIKNACAELALRASIAPLSEDTSVRVIQETIGPITVKYDPNSSTVATYTAVEEMLKPYMTVRKGSPMMKLSRC
jgi:hypothetical protein